MGMGYQGFVKFFSTGPATGPLVCLATGESINLVLEPIYSTAVWGAGWYNAATSAHYADNAIRYEGNVDFELQTGDIWDFIQRWALTERAFPRSLDVSPDGVRVYRYRTSGAYLGAFDLNGIWCTSMSLSTSEGSFVTASAGAVAISRSETDPDGGTAFSNFAYQRQVRGVLAEDCPTNISPTDPLNPGGANVDPIPFWQTNAQLLTGITTGAYTPFTGGSIPQTGLETVEWSIDQSNNHIVLYTANGNRLPTAVLMGPIDATGSVILYNENGIFDPIVGPDGTNSLTDPFLVAETTAFRVDINDPSSASGKVYVELPAVVVEADDYSIPGQDAVVNRTFTLKGLGGKCGPAGLTLPPILYSDQEGAFEPPPVIP